MVIAPSSVDAPRHVARQLIERISLTATILVLFAVVFVAGTAIFLIRSVLTSYQGEHKMMGATATQSSRNEDFDKQLDSLNERIDRLEQQRYRLGNQDRV